MVDDHLWLQPQVMQFRRPSAILTTMHHILKYMGSLTGIECLAKILA